MAINITLPDMIVARIQKLADASEQDFEDILLRMTRLSTQLLPELDTAEIPAMDDEQVLALVSSRMDIYQEVWLQDLLEKNGEGELTSEEKIDLHVLLGIYDAGNLRKAQAIAEAVKRGLKTT
jgi:hypothetical protein